MATSQQIRYRGEIVENHFKSEIEEVSLEGFQVVSVSYFTNHTFCRTPTCTFWPTGITFNKLALSALNNSERIRIEINSEKKCILIIPVTMKDKDSILWRKNVKEYAPRRIESIRFSTTIYELWGWNPECSYRAAGRIVSAESKVMLLFDFNKPETWKVKVKDSGITQ